MFRQICCCTTPLHPLVVPLLEAFVHSVINPTSKSTKNKEATFTLRGFTDSEVMSVFAAESQACDNLFHFSSIFFLVSNLLIKASKWTCDIENCNNCCHPKHKIGIFVWKIYFLPFFWIFLMIWKVFELNEWIQTLNLWHWSWLGFFLVCGVFLIG